MVTVEEWYRGLPPLTRGWFTLSFLTACGSTLGFPGVSSLFLYWPAVWDHWHLWRLVTCFAVFGGFSWPWITKMYLLTQYVRALELNHYVGVNGRAELLFMVAYGMLTTLGATLLAERAFPSWTLLYMLIYLWSRKDPHTPILVYGFTFQHWHVPAIMVVFEFVFGDPSKTGLISCLVGIAIGHVWHFLTEVVPRVYGKQVVTVPQWWYRAVQHFWRSGEVAATGATNEPAAPQRPNWMRGAGHRLDQ